MTIWSIYFDLTACNYFELQNIHKEDSHLFSIFVNDNKLDELIIILPSQNLADHHSKDPGLQFHHVSYNRSTLTSPESSIP